MRKAFIHLILIAFIVLPFQTVFALSTDYRFTGQELDRPTDLYYFDQRYYDPDVGKFTQPDPVLKNLNDPQKLKEMTGKELDDILSNPQALNEYSYTVNNPVRYIDPTGEDYWDVTTDIYFFNQSLSDYQEKRTFGNAAALAADTIGLLPIIPSGTGQLFKGFFKGLNYLSDLWKQSRVLKKFSVGVDEVKSILRSADNAYEIAKKGGDHADWLKQYINKTDRELQQGIKNFEKNVQAHIEKLRNPIEGTGNKFHHFSEYYQKGLINKWKTDLLRNQQQKNILQGILNERHN